MDNLSNALEMTAQEEEEAEAARMKAAEAVYESYFHIDSGIPFIVNNHLRYMYI